MPNRTLRFPQLAKEPLLTSRIRGNPENRIWAKCIDLAIIQGVVFLADFISPFAPLVLPVIFWSMVDLFGRGQSPGKWLLGLHTIEVQKGYIPNFYSCLVRNLPFILLTMGIGFSGRWSWGLALPALAWIGLETYFIFHVRTGLRIGDVLGNTRVNDYKDEHTKFIEQFLKEEEGI